MTPSLNAIIAATFDKMKAGQTGNGVPTGYAGIDTILAGGLQKGELIIIGARPSMGKTAFMLSLCRHVGASHQVLVLTQEDSHLTLTARHVAAAGLVNLADLRNPAAAPDSMWHGVSQAMDEVRTLRIDTDDQAGLTLADVRRKIQQTKRKHGELALVVIDYKTGTHVPATQHNVPETYLLQMKAYQALLQQIHPGKTIRCALVWTAAPALMWCDEAVSTTHWPQRAAS